MERVVQISYAILLSLAIVLAVPLLHFTWLTRSPGATRRLLDPDSLYQLALPAATYEAHRSLLVRSLRGSLLELESADIREILRASFTPDEASATVEEAHRSLVGHLRQDSTQTLAFYLPTRPAASRIIRHARSQLRRELRALEGCGLGQLLEIGWDTMLKGIFTDRDANEKLRDLPECDPPGKVEVKILQGITERLQALAGSTDSLRIEPRNEGPIRRVFKEAELARRLGVGLIVIALIATPAALWLLRRAPVQRIDATFRDAAFASSVLLLGIFLPLYLGADSLDLYGHFFEPRSVELGPSTTYWLRVVLYATEKWIAETARVASIVGAVCLVLLTPMITRPRVVPTPSLTRLPDAG